MIDKLSLTLNNTHDDIMNLQPIQTHIQKEKDEKTNKKMNTNTQKRHI